jgi:hypothetical protein
MSLKLKQQSRPVSEYIEGSHEVYGIPQAGCGYVGCSNAFFIATSGEHAQGLHLCVEDLDGFFHRPEDHYDYFQGCSQVPDTLKEIKPVRFNGSEPGKCIDIDFRRAYRRKYGSR